MKTHDIDAVTRGLAPTTGARVSQEAWADLSDGITATAVETPAVEAPVVVKARPRLVVVGAFSLMIVGAVAATLLNRPGQDLPQALSVTDQGDWLTVRVVDQDADPARYNEQFKHLGLNIKVKMVPVSPSLAGSYGTFLTYANSEGQKLSLLEPGENCPATLSGTDPGCQYGVEVDKSFKGKAEIEFGRAARPGEKYAASPGSANAPGEELQGLVFRNHTVDEVRQTLESRGITVASYLNSKTEIVNGVTTAKEVAPVPGGWYVHDAQPESPGVVVLWIGPAKEK
ncbi:MAG TPA: hypothetical protein VFG33_03990 [Kribbella sp.]|uniref:hypothetical protein n=1 Tax=Kribbella sp. TaxID=1871183 RepID=UPI002D79B098|nr:hypothetical protein [Kribbella sp.]HET6292503.1 hypothetical protein [Kribbella sp.]